MTVSIYDVHAAAAAPEHLRHVGILEIQAAGQLVVFLVERPAGNEDADHSIASRWSLSIPSPSLRSLSLSFGSIPPHSALRARILR